ncbi:MAG TPA: winged helix-turn-helix domain-containing protein [Candidatus Diapherotrites archaeon]|nr:winged helix-turn-helix domain-containing protein [Candidatus Diapherotrites archaeon]
MKIVLNTQKSELLNYFINSSKNSSFGFDNKKVEIYGSRVENGLFEYIGDSSIDAYVIESSMSYAKRAIDFIKKKTPYIPVILFGTPESIIEISGADIYIPLCNDSDEHFGYFYQISIKNILNYIYNFDKLNKLTMKIKDIVEFGNCKYDPNRRILLHNGEEIKKLSAKEGGIIEVLGSNFGEVVKKEIILEKVWHKSDYFSGRSMDVYITHLRNLFKEKGINLSIKNISGIGLILE